MSEIGKRIDGIIREGLAKELKAIGCKKSGRNFVLEGEESLRLVNVQASQWNFENRGEFTLNLGAYFPKVERLLKSPRLKTFPKEYECTVRVRIGELMPGGLDTWWKLDASTDDAKLAGELVEAWTRYGKPWFESMTTLQGLYGELFVRKNEAAQWKTDLQLAVCRLLGETDRVKRMLQSQKQARKQARTEPTICIVQIGSPKPGMSETAGADTVLKGGGS